MAHQRKSEENRILGDGIDSEIPWGLPSDDAHPDGEPHKGSTPPGAPEPGSLKSGNSIDSKDLKPSEQKSRSRQKPAKRKSGEAA